MKKTNPEEFARVMLWHLTGLRADLAQAQAYVLEHKAMLTGRTHQKLLDEWRDQSIPHHKKLYREALSAAGLQDAPEDTGASADPSDAGPSRL